jgi:hypothetical protein
MCIYDILKSGRRYIVHYEPNLYYLCINSKRMFQCQYRIFKCLEMFVYIHCTCLFWICKVTILPLHTTNTFFPIHCLIRSLTFTYGKFKIEFATVNILKQSCIDVTNVFTKNDRCHTLQLIHRVLLTSTRELFMLKHVRNFWEQSKKPRILIRILGSPYMAGRGYIQIQTFIFCRIHAIIQHKCWRACWSTDVSIYYNVYIQYI